MSEFEGEVKVFGEDIKEKPIEIKKKIGYIPENAAFYDSLTPLEFLDFVGELYDIPKEVHNKRALEMLEIFELKEVMNKRMTTFSKGMKQKVLISSGLIHDPEVIFMDEPLSGLDANSSIIIKEILSSLAKKGKTIFYCSHIMDVVERISDRIIIIDKGAVVADGSFSELQNMNKGESLERIFSQLTSDSGQLSTAKAFVDIFGEEHSD